jgi:NAD(P)-dependent dehydrogenase (short-subunit alcohol dehydrogenase family)
MTPFRGAWPNAFGADTMRVNVDITDRTPLHDVVGAAVARLGKLDVVFANAGVNAGPGFSSVEGQRQDAGTLDTVPADLWDEASDGAAAAIGVLAVGERR